MLSALGYSPVAAAADIASALETLRERPTALVLSGAVLPGGDGLALAKRIAALPLGRYPDIVLLRPAGLRLPGEGLLAGYGAAIVNSSVDAAALRALIEALRDHPRPLPPGRAARLEDLLQRLGVPDHIGRAMLINAVALAWRDRDRLNNLRDRIYPDAARPLGKTGAQAERVIRHVIEIAWRDGEIDEQQRLFGDTIDARRGRPTCGEMIAHLADILRREG